MSFPCTDCSLQFHDNHIYSLHLKLVHKKEFGTKSVKNETHIKNSILEIKSEFENVIKKRAFNHIKKKSMQEHYFKD